MPVTLRVVSSPVVLLLRDHVDTDQIIPARFLKTTEKSGLASRLFHDWRYDEAGAPRADFPLERPGMAGRRILVAGENFGCGSSREHAPWALTAWGISAVIARSFADIFRGNALKNALLPVALGEPEHRALVERVQAEPDLVVEVDLEREEVRLDGERLAGFSVDPFSRRCLLEGLDELGYLLAQRSAIDAHEARRAGGAS